MSFTSVYCLSQGNNKMAALTKNETWLKSFEPTEVPKWREGSSSEHGEIPNICQMVKEISEFIKTYKKKRPQFRGKEKKALRKLLIVYLFNIQQRHDIGVNDESQTEEIIEMEEDEKVSDTNVKPSFQTHLSVETELPEIHKSMSQNGREMPQKNIRETKNLYRAYKHLMQELNKNVKEYDNEQEFKPSVGLLEVDTIIVKTHVKLMTELIDDGKTEPGVFSTKKRSSSFQGKEIHYPTFSSVEVAWEAVHRIVDQYNGLVPEVNSCDDFSEDLLIKLFKRASGFLYSFLQLHPFSDGNGRLARLLTSYSLMTFSPFMTPIYNVFSPSQEKDYIKALVDTRGSVDLDIDIDEKEKSKEVANNLMNQPTKDLCAMLIESNWSMWRQFLYELNEKSVH